MVSKKTKLDALSENGELKKKSTVRAPKENDILPIDQDIPQSPKRRSSSRAWDEASGGSIILSPVSKSKKELPISSDISALDTKGSRVRAKVKLEESLKVTRTTWVDVSALKHLHDKIEKTNIYEPEGDKIVFRGVRTNNLKDIDVSIPKGKITTVVWVSGSGKSSFAFDTIYKEGQYRYIESLSSYLRQFFNLGERPEIDYTEWLSPAIAIEQNKRVGNARSTVGTITEIDDYMRLLFAKLGDIYSYGSGKMVKPQNVEQIVDALKKEYFGKRVYLVQEAGKYDTERDFLKFVKKNRLKVENNDWFTRYLIMTSPVNWAGVPAPEQSSDLDGDDPSYGSFERAQEVYNSDGTINTNSKKKWTKASNQEQVDEVETYGPNVNIIAKARVADKKQAIAKAQQDATVVEYFYLESPHIPEKFFPIKVYGIYDRVTIDDEKLSRIKEDIIKILATTKKFGVYQVLGEKLENDTDLAKAVDKDVFNVAGAIQRYTDKNYDPDSDISYPDFTTQHFSPNRPEWACQHCHGLGEILQVDMSRIIDQTSPFENAIIPWRDGVMWQTILKKLAQKYSMDEKRQWNDLPKWFQEVVINGDKELLHIGMWWKYTSIYYNGIQDVLTSQYNKGILWVDFQAMFQMQPCPECHGAKLRKESMYVFLYTWATKDQPANIFSDNTANLYTIFDFQRMSVDELIQAYADFQQNTKKAHELVKRIMTPLLDRLQTISNLWLGHLSLYRQVDTLSGGEIQRLRLAKQLGNKLTGIIYVLDEPTIWLDDKEINRTIQAIKTLKDMGNTIVVVEHNDSFIKTSDWIVEIGPGAGDFGGKLLFNGPFEKFAKSDTLTAQYLIGKKKIHVNFEHHPADKRVKIKKASQNNLKDIDVNIRLGAFTIITGPSGAGKTTLMYSTLYSFFEEKEKYVQWYIRLQLLKQWLSWNEIVASPVMKRDQYEALSNIALQEFYKSIGVETIVGHETVDNVVYVDQSSIGKTPRSCPATFIGVFDNIRKIFAGLNESKFLGLNSGHFSFNSWKGACPACDGYGYKKVELQFLPDTYVPCDLCQGKRYKSEILGIRWHNYNIADILGMYVYEALELFKDIEFIAEELQLMCDIGLGYLKMGQPAHTLSGWESQRIKLVKHLLKQYRGHSMYFLDEPTVGLHPQDIEKLLLVLKSFLDRGDTILMIEHDKTLLEFADDVVYLDNGKVKR